MRALIALAAAVSLAAGAEMSSTEYLDYVKYLASEDMRGRANGSPELERAANYIAERFRKFGLAPLQGDSYFQDFEVTTAARLGGHSALSVHDKALRLQADFVPLNISSKAKLSGQLVFAGYGITAPEYNYDDYAGVDVKGKIVVLLRHEPQETDPKSIFEGTSYTAHSQLFSKASNAKAHGAKAVLLVNDAASHPDDKDELEKFGSVAGPANSGIPFVQVTSATAAEWFTLAGKDPKAIIADIDKTLKPESFAFPPALNAKMNVEVEREVKTVHNVGAYLPGETAEYVIIGAHYDHLGLGEQFSLAPTMAGTVHPGADDNASGSAGVIELAHWFSQQPKPKRGVLFLTFAGEELGLLGSSYYANHPLRPLTDAVTMINMDMIGRPRDHKIYVGGAGSGTNLEQTVAAVSTHGLQIDVSQKTGYGASDHTSFTAKQVPVLFFFSGLHADYHKPGDTWDKIDSAEAVEVLEMVADITNRLSAADGRPKFVRLAEPSSPHDPAHGTVTKSGYGPDFGSIPDFTELPNGVRFADIRPGSPAAKAGLKAGDILTEFDGKPIQNLYDFTYALRAKSAGDEVLVKVIRGTQTIEAKVLLTARK